MTTNTGGPAFPVVIDMGLTVDWSKGMTLRDYFAAKAMQAYLAHDGADHVNEIGVARWAYEMADAMLKAREA
jgi:hypothetical protein